MKNKKSKTVIIIVSIVLILALSVTGIIIAVKNNKVEKNNNNNNSENSANVENAAPVEEVSEEEDKNVKIVDLNSKSRPYAIVINNTPVAVKVQTGLNKAYLVYEIPTEGCTSRLMALYKDIPEDLTVGTIRSARHNFVDYALESDAIFVHFGWSHMAEKDEKSGTIDYINGLFDAPFWRNNPEKLATEHTAYTSTDRIKQTVAAKKFRTEIEDEEKISLLNYTTKELDLSKLENAKEANQVIIPYDNAQNITSFIYDKDNKIYYRQENGKTCVDYNTKENVNTKNIIVQKISYEQVPNSKYWNLRTVSSGKGYYITNGYAVPITWKKPRRKEQTHYYYEDGTEIKVNDGRTYIEIQTKQKELTIK